MSFIFRSSSSHISFVLNIFHRFFLFHYFLVYLVVCRVGVCEYVRVYIIGIFFPRFFCQFYFIYFFHNFCRCVCVCFFFQVFSFFFLLSIQRLAGLRCDKNKFEICISFDRSSSSVEKKAQLLGFFSFSFLLKNHHFSRNLENFHCRKIDRLGERNLENYRPIYAYFLFLNSTPRKEIQGNTSRLVFATIA